LAAAACSGLRCSRTAVSAVSGARQSTLEMRLPPASRLSRRGSAAATASRCALPRLQLPTDSVRSAVRCCRPLSSTLGELRPSALPGARACVCVCGG
jgi:hypothetical protein